MYFNNNSKKREVNGYHYKGRIYRFFCWHGFIVKKISLREENLIWMATRYTAVSSKDSFVIGKNLKY